MKSKNRCIPALYLMAIVLLVAPMAQPQTLKVQLNGLEVGIDQQSGDLVYLASPATGEILEASPESSGLLDLAYPVDSFAAMRLASRFSKAQVVNNGTKGIEIRYEKLGASRPNLVLPAGVVSAVVTIRPADDAKSVILSCHIENKSAAPIPQEIFPDFWGLKPMAGVEGTQLRLAGGVEQPFADPIVPPDSAPFYAADLWKQYPPGPYHVENALRWLDYGGLTSGMSVFQKKWGTPDKPAVLTHRSELDPMSLRLVWQHKQDIPPGQSWDSGEFWLTPHRGGWAKGIEVFRAFVKKVNPPRELPPHVRDGIGYQTIWMMQAIEVDPAKAAFRFEDLPRIAMDAREYGIDEISLWGALASSKLPVPVRPELGSREEFVKAVERARESGVNIAPFISIFTLLNQYAVHYGVKPGNSDWTYHPELIPSFRPYYTHAWNGVPVSIDNELWRKDALATMTDWINAGVPSFAWDQFEGGLVDMIQNMRALARARDPESTFSGESNTNLEVENSVLDYTWNWGDYVDVDPITNVLRSPRLSCNVEGSPLVVKKAFADDLYINAMPRKPDRANGTALISEKPVLGAALKEVANLRRQFLPYFVDGTPIGDSVLQEPADAFVRGYQLGQKLLVVILNDRKQAQAISVESDLGLWLPPAKSYEVRYYDSAGKLLEKTTKHGHQWFGVTRQLQPLDLAFFEIQSK